MITFISGDIFDSECQTLVCPVNCVGVMGRGLAVEFRKRFPDVYEEYKQLCSVRRLSVGNIYFVEIPDPHNERILQNKKILLFPTKYHWKDKSNIEDIENGLKMLLCLYYKEKYKFKHESLAVPALGCGLGGLEWKQVRFIMIEYLSQLDIPVEIYEPLEEVK